MATEALKPAVFESDTHAVTTYKEILLSDGYMSEIQPPLPIDSDAANHFRSAGAYLMDGEGGVMRIFFTDRYALEFTRPGDRHINNHEELMPALCHKIGQTVTGDFVRAVDHD